MRALWLPLFVLTAWGCVPSQALGPRVSGSLTDDGEPLAGVPIYYKVHNDWHQFDCADPQQSTVTDDDGQFALNKPRKYPGFLMLGDPVMSWSVCAAAGDAMIPLWHARGQGGWNHPGSFEVDCDVNRPLSENDETSLGRCKIEYCDSKRCLQVVELDDPV